MNQVPIVRITELLARNFGLIVVAVFRHPRGVGTEMARFTATDRDGGAWQLQVSAVPCESLPAPVVHRWGCYWSVSAIGSDAGVTGAVPPVSRRHAAAALPRENTPAWNCADGRALERVGSWLAQPAGLPPATDILGQGFLDTWHRHRPHIAAMHARAEALHDALKQHAMARDDVLFLGMTPLPANEAFRHQRVLRHLVDSQRLLLGPQASAYPRAHRRDVLRSLVSLLEAGRARQEGPDTWWRAG